MDVFDEVARSARRYFRDCALWAAHELGVYAALEAMPAGWTAGGRAALAGRLAARLGVGPRRLARLLDVLALEGALQVPAPPRPSPPAPAGWGLLAQVIRVDRPLPEGPAESYHAHLREVGAEAARELAARLAPLVGAGSLLDLGGGTGAYAEALLRAAPAATVTLVDLPPVAALARAALAPFAPRVAFVEGDARVASLGCGHRAALLCNVLHQHPPETCALLVARAAAALAPGGWLVVKDLRVEPDRSGPPAGVLFALDMALYSEGGDVHDAPAIQGWLAGAGLREVRVEAMQASENALLVWGQRPLPPN